MESLPKGKDEISEQPEASTYLTEIAQDYDFSTKEKTIASIKKECQRQGLGLKTQIAYVLATVEWETARTFKPIKEMGGESYLRSKPYYPYFGRGFVQLTWKNNYAKYSRILGVDLVSNPD